VTSGSLKTLEGEFQVAVVQQYSQAVTAGYPDSRYRTMIAADVLDAAQTLAGENQLQGMFARMCGDRRFDLTIEWLVIQPRFRELFTPGLLEQARSRLRRGGYAGEFPN
jgi:hypothetical protein